MRAVDEQLAPFRAALLENTTLTEVLARAATMNLPDWYLVAGCLYQTVWNVVTRQPADAGILDYDLSWEAEDEVIRAGTTLFAGLPIPVQIRNQARVHLWYEQKFGVPCPTEATIASLGVRLEPDGQWRVYASSTSSSGPTRPWRPAVSTKPRRTGGKNNGLP